MIHRSRTGGTLPVVSPPHDFRERRPQMTRPEFLEDNLRVILRFWGARPKKDAHPDDPYHDLRLHDPIRDPKWIERFEAWMRGRGSSPQTRNHYRSVLRGLYRTALLPAYRVGERRHAESVSRSSTPLTCRFARLRQSMERKAGASLRTGGDFVNG